MCQISHCTWATSDWYPIIGRWVVEVTVYLRNTNRSMKTAKRNASFVRISTRFASNFECILLAHSLFDAWPTPEHLCTIPHNAYMITICGMFLNRKSQEIYSSLDPIPALGALYHSNILIALIYFVIVNILVACPRWCMYVGGISDIFLSFTDPPVHEGLRVRPFKCASGKVLRDEWIGKMSQLQQVSLLSFRAHSGLQR